MNTMITYLPTKVHIVAALVAGAAFIWAVGWIMGYLRCHKEWHTKAKELMKEPHA